MEPWSHKVKFRLLFMYDKLASNKRRYIYNPRLLWGGQTG